MDALLPFVGALAAMGAMWFLWWFASSNRSRHPDAANPKIDRVRFRMAITVGAIAGFVMFG